MTSRRDDALKSLDGWDDVSTITQAIVENAEQLREKHASDFPAAISYCAVFCQSSDEYDLLRALVGSHGELANETKTGPVYVVPPIQTVAGPLRILKVRAPDETRAEWGDADFALKQYQEAKDRLLREPGFKLVERSEFEMIELMDPAFSTRVYFSHPPVEDHSGIREKLSSSS